MSAAFKLVFFVPATHTTRVLEHLFRACPDTLGRIGNYAECAFLSRGTGQFRPVQGAKPVLGQVEALEKVEEDRVEVRISIKNSEGREEVRGVIGELKKVHPYEEVAYDVYRLEDF